MDGWMDEEEAREEEEGEGRREEGLNRGRVVGNLESRYSDLITHFFIINFG